MSADQTLHEGSGSVAETMQLRFAVQRGEFSLRVDLVLPARGVTALFGHSGSGKTSLLRVIAGLDRPQAGARIALRDAVWLDDVAGIDTPAHQRPVGVVFQEASLFSHLSVEQNLRFGERRVVAALRRVNFDRAVDLLGLDGLLPRRPETLSGGERQRVAIARALLTSPQLLLMDEPLAALDLKRKHEILPYLERLHRALDIPVIYVSHSPDEVARLADHLVLLDAGRVVAQGPLGETLSRLDLPTVFADDAGVVIEATLASPTPEDRADGLSKLVFPGGVIWVAGCAGEPGSPLRCRIHARDVSLARKVEDSSILNRFSGTITGFAATENPAHQLVRVDVAGTPLLARITRRSVRHLALAEGDLVIAQVKAVALLG